MISIEYINVYWGKFKKRLCCPIWRTEKGIMANSATALESPRFLVSLWNCCYVSGGDPNRPIFMIWWIFPKRSSSFRNGSCKHKQREVFTLVWRKITVLIYSQKDATDWPFSLSWVIQTVEESMSWINHHLWKSKESLEME